MVTKFEDNFWGKDNHGFEILLQNMKAGVVASKELADYVKERISVEDGYCKGLSKLHKSVQHVSSITLGGFAPLWEVVTEMSSQLSEIHGQFVKMLTEVNKEILDYNAAQKEKLKINMRGELELAQESLLAFQSTEASLQRTKKQYQQSVEHLAKAAAKHDKAAADPAGKSKLPQYESRVNQAKAWMETMMGDHQSATKRQCEQVMDFQGKMKEACQKFESIEEEHIAQMSTFMIKIAKTQDTHHLRSERVLSKVNEQLNIMSVEYLLAEVVKSKGTGRDRPVPYKFKSLEVPTGVTPSPSSEDVRATSPLGTRTASTSSNKAEKKRKGFLKSKKKKQQTANSTAEAEGTQATTPEPDPNVDAEGYSIRPEDAANIGTFPGKKGSDDWDSDSYSDDATSPPEPESRIKKITIKQSSVQPQATVDDIKASVMSLRIGSNSPGIRKATSSQSLNMFSTPPSKRREPSVSSQGANDQASAASLLDIDIILSGGSQLSGIPSPLQPLTSLPPPLLGGNPTETLTPWSAPRASDKGSQPSSTRPLLPERPPPVPKHSSEPTVPVIVVPEGKPPVIKEDNEDIEDSMETPPKQDSSESNAESKPVENDKEKTKIPFIQPPPRRSNTTPKRNTATPSDPARVVSPLAVNVRSASGSPNPSPRPSLTSSTAPVLAESATTVPLAVAFRETCNAMFHGTDVSKCMSKVTGEVVMSFPSNYLGELGTSEPLSFKLVNEDTVERVLHNQQLLKKDSEEFQYTFDMAALTSQLKQMKDKHTSPFYNVQLLKYEVKVPDPAKLPLKLVCYWKCEANVTNFRLDYSYIQSSLKTTTGEPKPLSNVTVGVPVNGGVKNALSKPTGNWNGEQNKMVWDINSVAPSQEQGATSLHAKFDLSSGPSVPSSAVVTFECDGAILSGLKLDLCTSSYKLSLLKFKCSSGKYLAEVR